MYTCIEGNDAKGWMKNQPWIHHTGYFEEILRWLLYKSQSQDFKNNGTIFRRKTTNADMAIFVWFFAIHETIITDFSMNLKLTFRFKNK